MKQNYIFRRTLSAWVLLMVSTLSWGGYDFRQKNADGVMIYYKLTNNDTEVEVTHSTDAFTASYFDEVNIPETVAYNGNTLSVTSIDNDAFSSCSGLTSVTIPNSVTSIGNGAFSYCSGLTSVTIPKSVTSIGIGAFSGCSSLTSVTIPNSVTNIGLIAFGNCSSLTSVIVDKGNTIYDSRDNCNAIIETASNTLHTGCQSTIIPKSVTSIGIGAFSGCSSLTSITIPESVTSISNSAFFHCTSLASLTIPEGVTSIGEYAFSRLTSINTILESVFDIGESAFSSPDSLTSVTIPNSVTSIGKSAFKGRSSLTTVYSLIENPFNISSDVFEGISDAATLYVPKGTKDAYESNNDWTRYFSRIIEN